MAQRKIKPNPFVKVRNSKIQGKGVFAAKKIRKGQRLIEYTGERITPTAIDVMMSINGFGPELFASTLTIDGFGSPGDEFTLSVTIENFGDDIAREVDAYLMAPFVSGWTILDQFSTSISSYGGTGTGAKVGDATWGWTNDQWHTY